MYVPRIHLLAYPSSYVFKKLFSERTFIPKLAEGYGGMDRMLALALLLSAPTPFMLRLIRSVMDHAIPVRKIAAWEMRRELPPAPANR